MDHKSDFIFFMARAGALLFGEFLTKSGRRSPYFINAGVYNTGAQIARLGKFYAACYRENLEAGRLAPGTKALFGPAYKGIPLAVSMAAALGEQGQEVHYCFNRKEAKDHGEGGLLVGYALNPGDRVLIVEDVITAGTAVREVLPILRRAGAEIDGLLISVDRMERGPGGRAAARELWEDHGIPVFPIVTVRDILKTLHNRPVDGKVLLDDGARRRMEAYMAEYCEA